MNQRGLTLVELTVSIGLLAVLAGIALPVAHTLERRARELELRQNLRTIRRAIDAYHQTVQMVPTAKRNATADDFPETLEELVEGIDLGLAKEIKVKFMRQIPRDPLTGKVEWGMRSNKQAPDDELWEGTNVFDVYSLAEGEGLDGVPYKEW